MQDDTCLVVFITEKVLKIYIIIADCRSDSIKAI